MLNVTQAPLTSSDEGTEAHHDAALDRCDGIEFDAIAPDEGGVMLFFKGRWKKKIVHFLYTILCLSTLAEM